MILRVLAMNPPTSTYFEVIQYGDGSYGRAMVLTGHELVKSYRSGKPSSRSEPSEVLAGSAT